MGALHVPQSKKNAEREGAIVVFVDEASFRQSPTLHQTWAPQNRRPEIPTRGERKTQKVLGAVSLHEACFAYRHQLEYFDQVTYRSFLEEVVMPTYYRRGHRIYLIQDNASYHKAPEVWDWFRDRQRSRELTHLCSLKLIHLSGSAGGDSLFQAGVFRGGIPRNASGEGGGRRRLDGPGFRVPDAGRRSSPCGWDGVF